jgi:ribonuclease P protein component
VNGRNTFKKAERISSQKEMDGLFTQGVSFVAYPLRVIFKEQKPVSGADVAILLSVSKKKFKRAVHRNRVKRLLRETYRLNKQTLTESVREKNTGLLIAFLYIGKELCDYKTIETAMIKALDLCKEKLP